MSNDNMMSRSKMYIEIDHAIVENLQTANRLDNCVIQSII